jgi:hypothetical protein
MYGLLEDAKGKGEEDDSVQLLTVPTPPRRRTEWYAIGFLVSALVVGVVLFAVNQKHGEEDKEEANTCYVSPSCPADRSAYDPATGFSNNTGWASMSSFSCCDICLEDMPQVVCFNEVTCGDKTGMGDYDYLLMDHISLQQMCRGMAHEFPYTRHDPTLTHLSSSRCAADADSQPYMQGLGLSIHGLWPNYVDGYPQCCGQNDPVDPEVVTSFDIWPTLQQRWKDPTVPNKVECEACYMLNHEWQKHGTCLSPAPQQPATKGGGAAADPDAVYWYFDLALTIDALMSSTLQTMNAFVDVVPLTSITELFERDVQVLCDPFDQPNNATHARFLELRTCWSMASGTPTLIDCPLALTSTFSAPCPANVVLTTSQAM